MTGDGGGILASAGVTVENNVISGNTATGLSTAVGGGIYIMGDALIVQNLIYNNNAGNLVGNTGGQGGGIYFMVLSGDRGPIS